MVSRNADSVSFALGIAGTIIGITALILTCISISLPTWFIGTNANNTITLTQSGLFSSCYISNASQANSTISKFTCVSFSSFLCSTTSYQNSVFNITAYIPGCTSPNSDSAIYFDVDAPIYQTSLDSFYRLRAAAALSIVSILFIFFSVVFGFLSGIFVINIYLVFIGPIFACIGVIFGVCCLVIAGSVLNYTGNGVILYLVGILLESIAIALFSIIAGRLNGIQISKHSNEDETVFIQPDSAAGVNGRRVQKRKN